MIHFPVFESLQIKDFGLYPGQENHTLSIAFKPGVTLVLGTNGLGKTTLITILYRMLTGPYELPKTSMGSELGGAKLEHRELNAWERATFADRVYDGAKDATSTLSLYFGNKRVLIQRHLKNLSLLKLSVGDDAKSPEEQIFQDTMCKLAGVWSFGDWLLMLRNLIFYFEDRRALVWDPSAQRQLFRFLFLPADKAEKWYTNEREILRLDSEARNDNAALGRLLTNVISSERRQQSAGDVKAELESLERLQTKEADTMELLVERSSEMDARRNKLRLDLLQNEQERENVVREIERAKLIAICSHFPSQNEIGQYLLAQFIVEGKCIACAKPAKEAAQVFSSRLGTGCCILCGSNFGVNPDIVAKEELASERLGKLTEKMEQIESRLNDLDHELRSVNEDFLHIAEEIERLSVLRDEREQRIAVLLKALPQDDAKIREKKQELTALQQGVNEKKARVTALGKNFETFVGTVIHDIQSRSDEVKVAFHDYAQGFLLETCELKWSPQESKIGQLGVKVEFPAFDLDMSGVDFPSPMRRKGPEQVSESQREFIDLAFRMALMLVAGGNYGGSLVIDAPESSLDGVFVERAAEVLARFGSPSSPNRLMVASNLVQGDLIPAILRKACPPDEALDRLVNLLDLATPTAAVREKRSEYQVLLQDLLQRGGLTHEP